MAAEREAIRDDRVAAALIPVLVWETIAVRMASAAEVAIGAAETETETGAETTGEVVLKWLAGGGLSLPMSSHSTEKDS
jgi:hypothetical protein